jgi:glycosyltransferase involved in cell wall biosynthesis
MSKKIRILFSNESSDLWIFQAYRSFFDALNSRGSYELFTTVCRLNVPDDVCVRYNVVDYCRINNPQVLEMVRSNLASLEKSDLDRADAASCWNSPRQIAEKLAYFKTTLKILEPDIVIGWNGLADIRLMVKTAVTQIGIPYVYAEKGMLPESWYIDPAGINACCSLLPECADKCLDEVRRKEILDYIDSITTSGASAWNQPQRLGRHKLLKSLNITSDSKLIFFPGQVDEDTNITLFSPIKSMAEAVREIANAMPGGTVLLVKPHPKSTAASQDALSTLARSESRIKIIKDVNVWDIIDAAHVVVSINSTVAFESMLRHKNVILLGQGVLTRTGLAPQTPADQLKQALSKHLESGVVDSERIHSFTDFLRNQYYMFRNSPHLSPFAAELLSQIKTRTMTPFFTRDELVAGLCGPIDELARRPAANSPAVAQSSKPRISVVLTAFNRPDMLKTVLDGFTRQTAARSDFEIVLVDDGSSLPLRELAGTFKNRIDINYIFQKNGGLAAARNTGIAAARGQIILFHDDDDLPDSALIAEHLESHRKYPDENVAVLGRLDWHQDLTVTPLMHYITGTGGQYFGFTKMQDGNFYEPWKWWGGLISAKASLLKGLAGPFDPTFRFGYEDTELVCRLLDRGVKILYNAGARKYILRPMNFEEFCARRVRQGRAMYHLACKHPAIAIKRYELAEAEKQYQAIYSPNLSKWRALVLKYELQINADPSKFMDAADPTVSSLHKIWAQCFRGYLLHGYIEEMSAVSAGGTAMGSQVHFLSQPVPGTRHPATSIQHQAPSTRHRASGSQTPLRIMVVSNQVPSPDVGSSNVRVHEILKMLAASGHKVELVYFHRTDKTDPYIEQWKGAIKFTQVSNSATSLPNQVYFGASPKPDVLWVTNLWTPEFFARIHQACLWFRRLFPDVRIVIDTMDYHCKKYERKYEYSHDPQDQAKAREFAELEKQFYHVGDCVVTVTTAESRDIAAAMPGCNCTAVPNIHDILPQTPPFAARRDIAFIGSLQINHNLDGVRWFVAEVFPLIRQSYPEVQFHIIGYGSESFRQEFESLPGVKVVGYVPDAGEALSQYRVFVCPLKYGAGMKGKIGSAVSAGTPVVTTSIGAEGFDFADGSEYFIADNPAQFADRCLALLRDEQIWNRIASGARTTYAAAYSPAAVKPGIDAILSSLMAGAPRQIQPLAPAGNVKIAVITAVYNGAAYLPEAIESVLAQTMQDWELWLLDDCSTDGTRAIIESYASRDKRIRAVCFDDNKGPYVRRNYAIEHTVAPFIVIHDADDIMTPTKLETLYNEISADDNLGVIGHNFLEFVEKFSSLKNTQPTNYPLDQDEIKNGLLEHRTVLVHGGAIIRKRLFETIGLYDTYFSGCDSFWLEKAAIYWYHAGGMAFKNISDQLMLRRVHAGSQTGSLPVFDPRSRRRMYRNYINIQLNALRRTLDGFRGEVEPLFKACSASDFLQRFADQIRSAESRPLEPDMLLVFACRATEYFNSGKFVSCISQLSSVMNIDPQVNRRFRNFDLLKAMAFYAIGMREHCADCIRGEIKNHHNTAARQFAKDYLETSSEQDILQWCVDYDRQFDLLITDTTQSISVSRDEFVSVIIPAYNSQAYIAETIQSVLTQTYANFELIVVDDGSTDRTAEIVAGFRDPRIHIIRKANGGVSSAHNTGIRQSRGVYIIKVDADDALEPDFIAEHLKVLSQHPDVDMVYCDQKLVDTAGGFLQNNLQYEYQDRRKTIRDMFRFGYSIILPLGCIRRKVFDIIGLYDETLAIAEDYDLIRRFFRHDLKAVRLSKPLYIRRMQTASLTRRKDANNAACHFKVIGRFVETFGPDELFPDVDWSKISPARRSFVAGCLVGATYRAIAKSYIQTDAPLSATLAFEQACTVLKNCVESEPADMSVRKLWDQCRDEFTRFSSAAGNKACSVSACSADNK